MWAAAENVHKAMRQEKNQKFFPFRAIALTDWRANDLGNELDLAGLSWQLKERQIIGCVPLK